LKESKDSAIQLENQLKIKENKIKQERKSKVKTPLDIVNKASVTLNSNEAKLLPPQNPINVSNPARKIQIIPKKASKMNPKMVKIQKPKPKLNPKSPKKIKVGKQLR
jgi:hypothetical protein